MPITTSPFLMNDVIVTLTTVGGTEVEYQCQLNQAQLTPSAGAGGGATYETFCDTFSGGSGNTTWNLDLAGFQQFSDADDLANFLFDNDGDTLEYRIVPMGGTISATNPGFEGTCTAVPTAIGGSANAYASFSVSLPCSGKPTKITTPPVFAAAGKAKEKADA